MEFTVNTIIAKANNAQHLFSYNKLCHLAEYPNVICDDVLKKYNAVNNGCLNKERFNFAIRHEFYAGYANALNLKCKPESLQHFIGEELIKGSQRTGKVITPTLIQSLKEAEKNGAFSFLFADIDEGNPSIEAVRSLVNQFFKNLTGSKYSDQYEYLIYATKSATEDNKRYRAVIPISGLIGLDVFKAGQKLLQETLNADEATALNPYQSFLLPLMIDNSYMQKSYYACYSPGFTSNFYYTPATITTDILNYHLGKIIADKKSTEQRTAPKTHLMEKKPSQQTAIDGTQLIYKFNTEVTTESVLNTHGFVISSPRNGKRYVSKQGSRGFDGSSCIFENSGKFKTFKTESPLYNDGKAMGSFDVFRILECNGDYAVAYREARKIVTC